MSPVKDNVKILAKKISYSKSEVLIHNTPFFDARHISDTVRNQVYQRVNLAVWNKVYFYESYS